MLVSNERPAVQQVQVALAFGGMRQGTRNIIWIGCALALALIATVLASTPTAGALQAGPAVTKIGNRIWDDLDGDGILDSGEPGVPAVVVELLDTNGSVVATRNTTINGYWNFNVDPSQTWQARIVAPPGRSFTTQNAGNDREIDSNADSNGIITIPANTLPPGGQDLSLIHI